MKALVASLTASAAFLVSGALQAQTEAPQPRVQQHSETIEAALQHVPAEQRWRYRWQDGNWYYWPPSGRQWLVWNGREWRPAGSGNTGFAPRGRDAMFETPNGLRGYSQHYAYRMGPAGMGYYGNPARNTYQQGANIADQDRRLEREQSGQGYWTIGPLTDGVNPLDVSGGLNNSSGFGYSTYGGASSAGQVFAPSLGTGGLSFGSGSRFGGMTPLPSTFTPAPNAGLGSPLPGSSDNPFGSGAFGNPGTGGLGTPTGGTVGPSTGFGGINTGLGSGIQATP